VTGIQVGGQLSLSRYSPLYAGVDYGKRKLAVAIIDSSPEPRGVLYDYDWPRPTTKRALAEVGPELLGDHLIVQESTASGIFTSHRPTLVAVERPLTTTRGGNATMDLNQVCGVLVLAARNAGATVVLTASSSWKKVVCGHGGFDKEQVAAWVAQRHPAWARAAPTQDCLDAFCLALGARMAAEAALVGADDVL